MQVDKTTLQDLSIFHSNETQSVFHYLNFTQTNEGRAHLRVLLQHPLASIEAIADTQKTVLRLGNLLPNWPKAITNGTILVLEKFFETPTAPYASHPTTLGALWYKLLKNSDYSLTKYTVEHTIGFIQGFWQIADLLPISESKLLDNWKEKIAVLLNKPLLQQMLQHNKQTALTPQKVLLFGHYIRHSFKSSMFELIEMYGRMDAYLSLAIACKTHAFTFPVFKQTATPFFETENLVHLQLATPVSYNMALTPQKNFLFLTGANMGGKSTFIKAIGIGVYLAHLGIGVPATKMELSYFDGLLSNIQVSDNITKGESYFFNEVQRIKSTVTKISNGKNWFILIDELFKGTNVQDAMKCSTTVIEGLRKMQNALFIVSTHLYEIGEPLKIHPNILFRYFKTNIENGQLVFSYQLQEGISNDRLGYLILQQEGVVNLLDKL